MADENMDDVVKWLSVADEELSSAERFLTIYPPIPPWMVCFHAQQASEKAIKAIIVSLAENHHKAAPKTHERPSGGIQRRQPSMAMP